MSQLSASCLSSSCGSNSVVFAFRLNSRPFFSVSIWETHESPTRIFSFVLLHAYDFLARPPFLKIILVIQKAELLRVGKETHIHTKSKRDTERSSSTGLLHKGPNGRDWVRPKPGARSVFLIVVPNHLECPLLFS